MARRDPLAANRSPGGVVFGSGSGRFSRRNQAVAALLMRAGLGTLLGDLPEY